MLPEQDDAVREMVRKSVESVVGLDARYRVQVVRAYEGALLAAFWWAVLAVGAATVMVCNVRLPKLGGVGEYRKVEEMEQQGEDEEEDE